MKSIYWIIAILFTFGLLIAGSDGPWFPWFNFLGLAMFAASAWIANLLDRKGF